MNKYQAALSDIKMEYREIKEDRNASLNEDEKAQFNLLQDLVERATPKRADLRDYGDDGSERRCPCCYRLLFDWDKFCSYCGQALK